MEPRRDYTLRDAWEVLREMTEQRLMMSGPEESSLPPERLGRMNEAERQASEGSS